MKQFYNLVAVCITGIILISCSSEPKKVSARELFENHQGLKFKLGEKKDTIFFTGISIDSNHIINKVRYIAELPYKNGLIDGKLIMYYFPSGEIKEVMGYKKNLPNGNFVGYFKSGIISKKGQFLNGEKDGNWNWYDEKGKVTGTENWINGGRMIKCTCCNKEFNSKEGWSAKPSFLNKAWDDYYPKQDGGEYCCKKCAIDCGGK
jgi:hypothetical protein